MGAPRAAADTIATRRDGAAGHRLGRRWQVLLVLAWALAFAGHWVVIMERRASHSGDFDLSRELGRRFVAGEPLYAGGLHYPYLPAAAAAYAPLALLDRQVAFTLRYLVALVCLWLTLRLLDGILRERCALRDADRLPLAAITVLLGAHYVFRDLDDAGPHLFLLFVLVAGIASVASGRATIGAACFGLAAALKPPCALLIPFFLWTRRWRLALTAMLALTVWLTVPMLWMGSRSWSSHHVEWARTALASAAGEPVAGADESESRPQNQALRPLIMRLLGARPTSASAERAPRGWPSIAANMAALGLLVLVALRLECGDLPTALLVQSSAVLVLTLLLSPVTWVQHLVLILPAVYVLVVTANASRPLGTGVRLAAAAYALMALVLNREIVGRTIYLDLLNLGLHTACMLLVLAMVIWWHPTNKAASGS